MVETLKTALGTLLLLFQSRSRLQVEILVLRQQGNEFEDRILAALVKKELVLAPGLRESNVILGSDDTTRKSTTLLPADAFELFSVSSHNELNVEASRGTRS